MVPSWLESASLAWITLSVLSAALVTGDLIFKPQKMWVMNLVWPLTCLYLGPFGLWMYYVFGRRRHEQDDHESSKPFWQSALTGTTHCGAGCAVGDFIGEWLIFATGLVLLGSKLLTKYIVVFALGYVIGIFFQYFAIAPMRGLGFRDGLWAALKADTLSLVAFEFGMFAWMALTQLVLSPGLEPNSWTFWTMMQVAMALGLLTAYPVNRWLIRRGLKEAM